MLFVWRRGCLLLIWVWARRTKRWWWIIEKWGSSTLTSKGNSQVGDRKTAIYVPEGSVLRPVWHLKRGSANTHVLIYLPDRQSRSSLNWRNSRPIWTKNEETRVPRRIQRERLQKNPAGCPATYEVHTNVSVRDETCNNEWNKVQFTRRSPSGSCRAVALRWNVRDALVAQ